MAKKNLYLGHNDQDIGAWLHEVEGGGKVRIFGSVKQIHDALLCAEYDTPLHMVPKTKRKGLTLVLSTQEALPNAYAKKAHTAPHTEVTLCHIAGKWAVTRICRVYRGPTKYPRKVQLWLTPEQDEIVVKAIRSNYSILK